MCKQCLGLSIAADFANTLRNHFRMKHFEQHKRLMLRENLDQNQLLIDALKKHFRHGEVRDFIRSLPNLRRYEKDFELKKILKSKLWLKWSAGDE